MTVSRPPVLAVDAEVLIGGSAFTVVGLSGTTALLADVTGAVAEYRLVDLFSGPGFPPPRRP
jgi:hypothetical protein